MLAIVLTCRVHLPFPPHFSNPLFPSNPPFPALHQYTPYNRMNHPFSYVSQNSRSLTTICCVSINTVSTPVFPFVTFYTIFSPPATDVPKCNYYCEYCVCVGLCVTSTTRAAGQVIDQWSLSSSILFWLSERGALVMTHLTFFKPTIF